MNTHIILLVRSQVNWQLGLAQSYKISVSDNFDLAKVSKITRGICPELVEITSVIFKTFCCFPSLKGEKWLPNLTKICVVTKMSSQKSWFWLHKLSQRFILMRNNSYIFNKDGNFDEQSSNFLFILTWNTPVILGFNLKCTKKLWNMTLSSHSHKSIWFDSRRRDFQLFSCFVSKT